MCFSLLMNTRKIFHVGLSSQKDLQAVHGVRFLSMTWVMLGHTLAFILTYTSEYQRKWSKKKKTIQWNLTIRPCQKLDKTTKTKTTPELRPLIAWPKVTEDFRIKISLKLRPH